jgi:hypothetical protein
VSELRFHTFNPSTTEALMTDKSISIKQLEARIDTLELALLALLGGLPSGDRAKFQSRLAGAIEEACSRPEPVNETDPYRLEMRAFVSRLLG